MVLIPRGFVCCNKQIVFLIFLLFVVVFFSLNACAIFSWLSVLFWSFSMKLPNEYVAQLPTHITKGATTAARGQIHQRFLNSLSAKQTTNITAQTPQVTIIPTQQNNCAKVFIFPPILSKLNVLFSQFSSKLVQGCCSGLPCDLTSGRVCGFRGGRSPFWLARNCERKPFCVSWLLAVFRSSPQCGHTVSYSFTTAPQFLHFILLSSDT